MKLEEGNNAHTILCDQGELELIREALDYYTQNVAYERSDNINNPEHPNIIKAMKYEDICQSLNIDGYEFT